MKHVIKRVLSMLALVVFCYLLQTVILNKIPYVSTAPNMLLILTFTVGLLRGRAEGMTMGFFCGLLLDVFSGGILCFYALIYMYIGYLNGIAADSLVHELILLPLVSCFLSEVLFHSYQYIFGFFIQNQLQFRTYFEKIVMPELVLTIIAAIIVYYFILRLNQSLEQEEQKGAKKFA